MSTVKEDIDISTSSKEEVISRLRVGDISFDEAEVVLKSFTKDSEGRYELVDCAPDMRDALLQLAGAWADNPAHKDGEVTLPFTTFFKQLSGNAKNSKETLSIAPAEGEECSIELRFYRDNSTGEFVMNNPQAQLMVRTIPKSAEFNALASTFGSMFANVTVSEKA